MVQVASPAPSEPNYTITDFTGNGTTSVTIDLGISNPAIIIIYAKAPLTGSFPSSKNNQRLFQFYIKDYDRDIYANTRSSSSTGHRVYSSTSHLSYSSGTLSFSSSSVVFRSGYAYRVVAIKQPGSNCTITEITGAGSGSISVDLGISNPTFLFVVKASTLSGTFPASSSTSVLCLFDKDISTTSNYYAVGYSSSATGYLSKGSALSYQNGTLTVGSSTVLENGQKYLVIAI